LLQDRVRGVAGESLAIDGDMAVRNRTKPDFMIALALPSFVTAVVQENPLYSGRVVSHQLTVMFLIILT
jgi:hypothetical protein